MDTQILVIDLNQNKTMKTIIIPDVHERLDFLKAIMSFVEKDDRIIMLGDLLDSFDNTPDLYFIENFFGYIEDNITSRHNTTMLFGNHDLPYSIYDASPRYFLVSGYKPETRHYITKTVPHEFWEKFKLYTTIETKRKKYFISHAGFHRDKLASDDKATINNIDKNCKTAICNMFQTGTSHEILRAGYARCGEFPFGGLVWLDWNKEFSPIANINQIVGHTSNRSFRAKCTSNSENYCVDAMQSGYITINDDDDIEFIKLVYDKNGDVISRLIDTRDIFYA
jgi:hypothetical protein